MDVDEIFYRKLKDGYRMKKPKFAPVKIYDIMMDCWQADPASRPDFNALSDSLGLLLESSVRRFYIELNNPHTQTNAENVKDGLSDYLSMSVNSDYVNSDSFTER